jgi:uncharacterized protein YbbK (DUF523 family)
MDKILVSACLLGEKCRYDGKENKHPLIEELNKYFDLVPFCPEVEGGLPTPRSPSELKKGRVYNQKGENVTKYFNLGAEKALKLCKFFNIHIAVLKDKSPSCGVYSIYDGTFTKTLKKGQGVTASLLSSLDYWIMSEDDLEEFIAKQKERREYIEAKTEEYKEKANAPKKSEEESSSRESKLHYGERRDYGERRHYEGKKPYREHKDYSDEKKPFRKDFGHDKEGADKGKDDYRPYKKRPYTDQGDRTYKKSFHADGEGYKKKYGDKPYKRANSQDGSERPYHKRFADKPYGHKDSLSDKKPYQKKRYGESKPYGGKKRFGEKKNYKGSSSFHSGGFKKSYGGARKSYAHKPSGGKESGE